MTVAGWAAKWAAVAALSGCAFDRADIETEQEATLTIDPVFSERETQEILQAWEQWKLSGSPLRSIVVYELTDPNLPETWVGAAYPGGVMIRLGFEDIYTVALHEIGHALGALEHHNGHGVMVSKYHLAKPCISPKDLELLGVAGPGTCGLEDADDDGPRVAVGPNPAIPSAAAAARTVSCPGFSIGVAR